MHRQCDVDDFISKSTDSGDKEIEQKGVRANSFDLLLLASGAFDAFDLALVPQRRLLENKITP